MIISDYFLFNLSQSYIYAFILNGSFLIFPFFPLVCVLLFVVVVVIFTYYFLQVYTAGKGGH